MVMRQSGDSLWKTLKSAPTHHFAALFNMISSVTRYILALKEKKGRLM